jgi:hypothetical protein
MIMPRWSIVWLCWGLAGLPVVAAEPAPSERDGWRSLFDGTSLQGWRASENPNSFQVVEGAIVADGPRAHLFYSGDVEAAHFQDFEFRAEVRPEAGANSGIFFHTGYQETGFPERGYEAQINNAAPLRGGYIEHKKTGSLYGVRNQYKSLVQDGQWFTLHIAVRGRRVQIRVNETPIVDFQEPGSAPIDPQHPGRRLSSGTFALQCHDPQSKVAFRNIQVRPLPTEAAGEPREDTAWDAVDLGLAALARDNYPLIDFHTHLKGGLTLEQVLQHSHRTGIGHGVAVNCGLGFPVTDDASALDFLKSLAGQPVFAGMQAEGREWRRLFAPETIAKFDYVFTDSMTIVDHRGQRARLWIKEEVEIPDEQAFMERLVATIEGICANEPIDIYVNPTYLPAVIADKYDALWTPERVQRVIDAAAKNGIAIEISNTHRLPKPDFIRLAKQAGVKFTFGTNNSGPELRRLEYCLEMVEQCGLTWQDMWTPKPDGQKPIQVRRTP